MTTPERPNGGLHDAIRAAHGASNFGVPVTIEKIPLRESVSFADRSGLRLGVEIPTVYIEFLKLPIRSIKWVHEKAAIAYHAEDGRLVAMEVLTSATTEVSRSRIWVPEDQSPHQG